MLSNDGIYFSIMCKKISGWSLCKGGYIISVVRVTGYFYKGHLEHTQVYNENRFSSLVQQPGSALFISELGLHRITGSTRIG